MRSNLNNIIVVGLFLLISVLTIDAQSYNSILGVRFGDDIAISAAQRVSNHTTVQLNHEVGFRNASPQTSAYFIKHTPILTRRLNVFAGVGAFVKLNNGINDAPTMVNTYGPSGTLGAEFTIGRLNFAADWSPTLNINKDDPSKFNASTGISLRYVIIKRKSKIKSWREKMSDKYFKKKKKSKK